MIKQGADGLSRGNLDNGVMIGEHMLEHVPIHLLALERVEHLHEWISSWVDPDARFFTPEDWYHNAHQGFACGVWTPPPAIADAALEQLCDARHTRPTTFHVIATPNIMTYLWRKTLRKLADVMFLVPLGNNVWPSSMHESLTIAIVAPLLNRMPWSLRSTKLTSDLEKDMSGVWDTDCRWQGARLRKCWDQATSLGFMSGSLTREWLQAEGSGPVPNSEHKGPGGG
jgi:hypothetical protein